jgi:hypothetical protein
MFEYFCGLLITNQHVLLEEGNIGGKHQAHLLKGKGNLNHKERGQFDTPTHRPRCLDQKPKGKIDAPHQSQKKKKCQYYGKTRHVEKFCYKKSDDLEEKVKCLEGDVFIVHRLDDNFISRLELLKPCCPIL